MLLIPLWPKETTRFPAVTVGLVVANLIVFLIAGPLQRQPTGTVSIDDVQSTAQKLTAILLDPDSRISDSDRTLAGSAALTEPYPSPQLVDLFKKIHIDTTALNDKLRYQWDLVYPLFESYQRAGPTSDGDEPLFKRWGFNPQRPWWPGIVTHQFVHDGWVHLLFNMLFLWITASIAEDLLGIHLIWLYIVGGIAAALAQVQYGIPSGEMLVGASGALSAVMGFCLVTKAGAKVRLFYLAFIPMPKFGSFDCPLWFFLPIWLLTQILMALVIVDKSTVSTAYIAHIAGFAFGCLMGLVKKA